jgi:nucleotide-binding universal stress UspA family protein
MKILLCSDGTASSDNAARVAAVMIGKCKAAITLFGIAEQPQDEQPLRAALEKEAEVLRAAGLNVTLVVRAGDPIRQIVDLTGAEKFDLTIIGTRGQGPSGLYLRSRRTYEAVKAVHSPVLVVIGDCEELKRFLVCTGGKRFIDDAVGLTGKLAACAGASVTLLHVMAEPPALYADLVELEEDVDQLIVSGSELGENLCLEKETLEKLGVPTEIRVRHGLVLEQIFKELREGDHDLIVTGSSQATGPFRHYIMGDLTRGILNRANCPVLVARSGKLIHERGFFPALRRLFSSGPKIDNSDAPANAE